MSSPPAAAIAAICSTNNGLPSAADAIRSRAALGPAPDAPTTRRPRARRVGRASAPAQRGRSSASRAASRADPAARGTGSAGGRAGSPPRGTGRNRGRSARPSARRRSRRRAGARERAPRAASEPARRSPHAFPERLLGKELSQRPERDSFPVRETAPDEDAGLACDAVEELSASRDLPIPGWPRRQELGLAGLDGTRVRGAQLRSSAARPTRGASGRRGSASDVRSTSTSR